MARRQRPPPQKKAISAEEYRARYNNDVGAVPPRYRMSMSSIRAAEKAWKKWMSFCADQAASDPVNNSGLEKLSSALVSFRHWRIAYRVKVGHELDPKLVSEMMEYACGHLVTEFGLSERRADMSVLNVDDLMAALHCHWSLSDAWFATERQRLQLALLMLLIAYTGARPATIVEAASAPTKEAGARDPDFLLSAKDADLKRDCLKHKDFQIYKVLDP